MWSTSHGITSTAMLRQPIVDLLSGFSAETTPGAARKIADYRAHLRPGTTVYITFLPGSDFDETVDLKLFHSPYEVA